MPIPCRDPSEMTPRERLDEFTRLLAHGVVRLCRRLLSAGEPLPAGLVGKHYSAMKNKAFSQRNDLRSGPK